MSTFGTFEPRTFGVRATKIGFPFVGYSLTSSPKVRKCRESQSAQFKTSRRCSGCVETLGKRTNDLSCSTNGRRFCERYFWIVTTRWEISRFVPLSHSLIGWPSSALWYNFGALNFHDRQ